VILVSGLSEEHTLNRMLRIISGPKRLKVTGGYRKLHNVCISPSRMIKSRRMRWAGHVARMAEDRRGEEWMQDICGKVRTTKI
jgi:hypothetical protein